MISYIFMDRIAISAFAALLIMAALSDVKSFRIPNLISVLILVLYPLHFVFSASPIDGLAGLLTGGGAFAAGAFCFARGWMGGGDVKLMAACALWSGYENITLFVIITAFAGAVLSCLMLSRHRFSAAMALEGLGCARGRDILIGRVIPYGVAIAAGGLAVAFRLASATY